MGNKLTFKKIKTPVTASRICLQGKCQPSNKEPVCPDKADAKKGGTINKKIISKKTAMSDNKVCFFMYLCYNIINKKR